jgi:ABC-type nitrate/sulfonate/bicarbonate transport system permease component
MHSLYPAFARRLQAGMLPGAVLLVFMLAYELVVRAGWTPSTIAPPSLVFETLFADRDALLVQIEPTILTAAYGFLIAALVAFSLGFLVYVFRRAETTVSTVGAVLSSIPMIAIAPALIVWMGPSLTTRITITAILCVFPILVSVIQGLGATRPAQLELFHVMAASPAQQFRLLALPNSLPYLFIGLKISAPLAILGALVAEWTGAESGLGVIMLNAMFSLQVGRLWSTVFIACALSTLAYGYICLLERLSVAHDIVGGEAA